MRVPPRVPPNSCNLEYAVLHASILPGAAEALKGSDVIDVSRDVSEFGLKTGGAAVRTSVLRTNPVHTGLWFRQQPARS